MKKKYLLLVILIIIETPAQGMVYAWSDSFGIRHYVNSVYDIPARYRARAKPLYPEASDLLAPLQGTQLQAIQSEKRTQPPHSKTKGSSIEPAVADIPKPRHKTKLGINLKKSVGHRKNPELVSKKK